VTAKNPRVNVVLEEPVYKAVKRLSAEYKISMSMVIRDMVREEVEKFEDRKMSETAKIRDKSRGRSLLKHEDFWK
jgi:metal-responsive CopG/Arc/MetJ family transcriptional regulator